MIVTLDDKPLTPLQRIGWLLTNVPAKERGRLLTSLEGVGKPNWDPHVEEVGQACRRAFEDCESAEKRAAILMCAEEFADALERQEAAFEGYQSQVQLVATFPDFLYLARQGALPPVEQGSLELAMASVAQSARYHLDMSIPYISTAGVEVLMSDFGV